MTRPRLAPFLMLALSGCVIGQDKYLRPRDLSPSWLVDRVRILAIVADPPEVAPGDTVAFDGLVATPLDAEPQSKVWLACPPAPDGTTSPACGLDTTTLSSTTGAAPPTGVIGVEPGYAPVWTVPDDLLASLAPEELEEGLYATIQLMALPTADLLSLDPSASLDFAEIEVGIKRLVVSEAATPNQNPTIEGFQVEGLDVATDVVVEVDPLQPYELTAILAESAIETYLYTTSTGLVEERIEEPYVTWYATDGDSLEHITLAPYLDSTWVSPEEPGTEGTWWAVVRDRRGGMGWIARSWVVR